MKRIKQFERTDRDITNALLLLLEKNRFEKITVAQIIEEAGINRSTFYQHFSDKYEIVERLQAKYLDEFVAVAQSVGAMENPDLNDYAIALQAYFQKNRSILKKIFSIQSSSPSAQRPDPSISGRDVGEKSSSDFTFRSQSLRRNDHRLYALLSESGFQP